MFILIVSYLLLYPPSDQARAVLQAQLEGCKDSSENGVSQNKAVYDLGRAYLLDFILPMCKHRELLWSPCTYSD